MPIDGFSYELVEPALGPRATEVLGLDEVCDSVA